VQHTAPFPGLRSRPSAKSPSDTRPHAPPLVSHSLSPHLPHVKHATSFGASSTKTLIRDFKQEQREQ
jgi:hypothetical protein